MSSKGDATKKRICEAAVRIINRDGYDAATVERICEEAEVSNGAFFHHFKTKDDVLVQYVCNESDELRTYYASLDDASGIEAFRDVVAWQANYYKKKGEEFVSHLFSQLTLSKRGMDIGYSLTDVLTFCIERAQAEGDIGKHVDARLAAEVHMNDMMGYAMFVPWNAGRGIVTELEARADGFLEMIGTSK